MELTRHDGGQAGQLADELREVYAAVFTEPPFLEPAEQAELFAREVRSELGAPGFACWTAREDGRLHRWIRDQFAVAWFAVRPEARGRGIGSRRELGRGALGWDREERLVLGLERRAGQRRAATTM
jgi:GNAT superfamily N-acetyltransferase